MKKLIFSLGCCWTLVGCGGSPVAPKVAEGSLVPSKDVSLKALLDTPRAELAKHATELEQKIQRQDQLRLAGQLKFGLLPQTRLPLAPPVWREAKFSAERTFSVPPYLADGVKDTPLALHLARHGDRDAASLLAEPGAQSALSKLNLERSYPLEWTRLVGLLLHHAQFTLATDNVEGAKQLMGLHLELRELLPRAAQQSALGQALLARGLNTMREAAEAWKQSGRDTLGQQAESFVAKLDAPPAWQWSLPTTRAELAQHLGQKGAGLGEAVPVPLRALDLLALPAPHDQLDACWTFFEGSQARELLLVYRSTQVDYEQPGQWVPQERLLRQGTPSVIATLTPGNPFTAGVIQVRFAEPKSPALTRDFALVHLDRTFEHNRRALAWKRRGVSVAAKDAKVLADLRQPLPGFTPAEATLERVADHDLASHLRFAYAPSPKHSLVSVAKPLWERHGAAQMQIGSSLTLTWDDAQTRYVLSLPNYKDQPFSLEVTDSSGAAVAARAAAARARDQADRQTRLANNRPLARLPRSLETLKLGMKRADVERMLPGGVSAVRREIPQGLMATYGGQAKTAADAVLRMLFARFDEAGQLVELRARYADFPSNKPGTFRKKFEALQAAHGPGDPSALSANLFADLPAHKGPAGGHHTWQDDITRLTCSVDSGGLEMVLLNCPLPHPTGEPLAAFTFLPRGPQGMMLGARRSDVLAQGGAAHEDALLVKTKPGSPFDTVIVWFENENATRIVARHRFDAAKEPAKHLLDTWGREMRTVGWPWRQDLAAAVPQSWTTFDAGTRYRLFWQEDNQGTFLFSEWREAK